MSIDKAIKKISKRITLGTNRTQGRIGEAVYVVGRSAEGYEVRRTGKGSDYEERKLNPFTGKKGPKTLVEVKSGNAKLSKLQKKTKKKSARYRVERGSFW